MAHGHGGADEARGEVRVLSRLGDDELAAFHRGDEDVFRSLVERHSPRLLAFVRPFAADADHAHDLLQDTWQRVVEKRRRFSGDGSLVGWLWAVCRNVCLGADRRAAARSGPLHMGNYPIGTPPTEPDAAVEQLELRRSIHRAVMELPERERGVVVLRMLEQRSTRETAEILGCAEGTVKASLHHALKKLQVAMDGWTS